MLRIEAELKDRGIGQFELSLLTGIHPSTLSRLVAGKTFAYPGWRRRLAEALGVDGDALFTEVESDTKAGTAW